MRFRYSEQETVSRREAALKADALNAAPTAQAYRQAEEESREAMKYDVAFTPDGVSLTLTETLPASEFRSPPPATHVEPTHPMRTLELIQPLVRQFLKRVAVHHARN
jgi:hypothetical protein